MEQSSELAVGVKCGMLKTAAVLCLCVWYTTRHGIPVWDPPHRAQHGVLGVSAWGSRWGIRRTHTCARGRCV
jgi:hypothetical protein